MIVMIVMMALTTAECWRLEGGGWRAEGGRRSHGRRQAAARLPPVLQFTTRQLVGVYCSHHPRPGDLTEHPLLPPHGVQRTCRHLPTLSADTRTKHAARSAITLLAWRGECKKGTSVSGSPRAPSGNGSGDPEGSQAHRLPPTRNTLTRSCCTFRPLYSSRGEAYVESPGGNQHTWG